MISNQNSYDELYCYTLTHSDPAFILQHVVDAYAAQTATEQTKPIQLTFALIGLYLHVEKSFSGKQVQQSHMLLAQRQKQSWPTFSLPRNRGSISVIDVMAKPEGAQRDRMIHEWCISVWNAFKESWSVIAELVIATKIDVYS